MPATVSHQLSATTPSDPQFEIQVQHWNQSHAVTLSATAGTEIFGAFSNDPTYNVSFSTNAGGQVVASANVTAAPSPINITGNGSSVNAQTLAFTNANGLTLGVSTAANAATITGSYTVPVQSIQTQPAGGIAGSGFTTTATVGVVVAGTNDSGGLKLGVPPYITTYAAQTAQSAIKGLGASNTGNTAGNTGLSTGIDWVVAGSNNITISESTAAGGPNTLWVSGPTVGGAQTGISSVALSNTTYTSGQISFRDGNNISWASGTGQAISITHALQSSGNYLTTAAQSNQVVNSVNGSTGQISFATGSSLSSSSNGSTITFGLASNITTALQSAGAYLTTAAQSSASNVSLVVAATNNTGGGTASLSGAISFSNANSLTFYTSAGNAVVGSFSTSQSVQTQASGAIAGSGFTSGGANVGMSGTHNSAGLSLSVTVAAQSVQTQASGAIAGSGFTTSSTTGSVLVGTNNSAGLSLGVPAWLTVAAGGGVAISASGASQSAGTVVFSNSNGVSFGMNGSTITATVQPGAAAGIGAINNSNTTYTSGTVQLTEGGGAITIASNTGQWFAFSVPATSSIVGTNGVSISSNGSTISVFEQNISTYAPYFPGSTTWQTLGAVNVTTRSAWFFPFQVINPIQFNALYLLNFWSLSTSGTAANGNQTITSSWGLYTNNASTLSQISSGSFSLAATFNSNSGTLSYPSVTATNSYTYTTVAGAGTAAMHNVFGNQGNRNVGLVFGNSMSLSQGNYWLGLMEAQSSANFAIGISGGFAGNVFAAMQNIAPIGIASSGNTTATAAEAFHPFGVYTSTGSAGYGGTALPASAFATGFNNSVTCMPMFTFMKT